MVDRVGQRLGNYRLTRLLGKGGFAEVYLGEHVRLGTRAAVKVLYTRLATPDEIEHFEKEARTIAHLKHAHIVRILDYDVEDDIPFLVMDYAEGGTLRQRHAMGTILPIMTIVSYVQQVAAALQHAHDQRLIHRDVKPENMLVGEHNTVLLSDFGIALVAQSTRSQSTQEMMGTIPYIAPEQIQGRPRMASDQYSLGIVVYEWLSGDRPFHGSMTEIIAQHLAVPPPPLRERVPAISPGIEAVVMRALAKDAWQRFESVQMFSDALEQAARQIYPGMGTGATTPLEPGRPPLVTAAATETAPAQAPLPSVTLPATSPSQSSETFVTPTASMASSNAPTGASAHGISRRAIIVGLGIAGLAVAVGGFTWLASHRTPLQSSSSSTQTPTPHTQLSPSPPQASASPTQVSTSPAQSSPPLGTVFFVYRGHTNGVFMVAWSPNGQRIASGSYDGTVQVWDASTGGNAFTYRGHASTVEAVAWSPNGQRIASGSGDNTVQVWDAATGGNVLTYRGHTNGIHSVAWSPDGQRIASGSFDHTVQVWDATTGGTIYIYRGHSDTVYGVAWSPDGQRIASGSKDHTVQVWDATTGGDVLTYRGHTSDVGTVAWSPDGLRIVSGAGDHTAQVWDAATGSQIFTYQGHTNEVHAVAWSPDGRRIVSGSFDVTVQIWDATTGGNAYIFNGHFGPVFTAAWSPDGRRVASGGLDRTVQVWQAD